MTVKSLQAPSFLSLPSGLGAVARVVVAVLGLLALTGPAWAQSTGTAGSAGGAGADATFDTSVGCSGFCLSLDAVPGGVGGTGGMGGTGVAPVSAGTPGTSYTPNYALAGVVDLSSTGGAGITGGTGGIGGVGGQGGNGTASYESAYDFPLAGFGDVVADGGAGGVGGVGGTGSVGGLGGAGGTIDAYLASSISSIGDALYLRSYGGIGGTGGTGGQGGTGGRGGNAGGGGCEGLNACVSDPGMGGTGGAGGVGGVGGQGGAGGAISLSVDASVAAIGGRGVVVISQGGTGGTGGTGGVGGTGGRGGDGEGQDYGLSTATSNGGDGGDGGTGGQGGTGGKGGTGGAVILNLTGAGNTISISGNDFAAVLAISAGGTGGTGGTGGAGGVGGAGGDPGVVTANILHGVENGVPGTGGDAGSGGAAGDGGAGGDAGSVSLTNAQSVVTSGDNSSALAALSLGGIGGQGGSGGSVGSGGAGGAGRNDDCTAFLNLCFSFNDPVVYAAGADGGVGSAVAGASGSASTVGGDGGAVSLINHGVLATSGASSHAIMALSLPGIYGLGGVNANTLYWTPATGGQSGAAGPVSVASDGAISTTGDGAAGIMALSESRGAHDSGSVTVTNSANISATGAGSSGILAASRAAGGTSGAVSVTNSATVSTDTLTAATVIAESTGQVKGAISVTNSGQILAREGGTALRLIGGSSNVIENSGTISAGVQGMAIMLETSANSTIYNRSGATITGSIDPVPNGYTVVQNDQGGLVNAGSILMLGNSVNDRFINAGTLSPGGMGLLMRPGDGGTVSLTGNYEQTSTGNLLVDIRFVPNVAGVASPDEADLIHVSGTATVDGIVTLNPENFAGGPKPGTHRTTLLLADGGVTDNGIRISDMMWLDGVEVHSSTPVFTPFITTDSDEVFFNYTVDYNPDGLSRNQSSVANAVNGIQGYGVPAFAPVAQKLYSAPDLETLGDYYDSLSGEGTLAAGGATLATRGDMTTAVLDKALSCVATTLAKVSDPTRCDPEGQAWFTFLAGQQRLRANDGIADTESKSLAYLMGLERGLSPALRVGGFFGLSHSEFNVPERWTQGATEGTSAGLYARAGAESGPYGLVALNLGTYGNHYDRLALDQPVSGQSQSIGIGATGELGWRMDVGSASLRPYLRYGRDVLRQLAYDESDPVYGNHFAAQMSVANPGVIGLALDARLVERDDVRLSTTLGLALVHEFNQVREATVNSLTTSDFTWSVASVGPPRNAARLNAALKLEMANRFDLELAVNATYADTLKDVGANVQAQGKF